MKQMEAGDPEESRDQLPEKNQPAQTQPQANHTARQTDGAARKSPAQQE